ncbi:hypothetical protein [Streptomyces sp. NPDC058308]|uniref:hypothetical protein n=1 Tax=Streptomyces sp. NPDC058308 TaxID=3346440 RepID=UPI0036ED4E8B
MLSRARMPWCPLVGVLLVLLVVLGMFCAPAVAGRSAPAVVAVPSAPAVVAAPSAVAPVAHSGVGHDRPGCGKGTRQDGGEHPASPPRSSSAYELLPALYEAHGGVGSWGADQAFLDLTPVRGPPELVPPSPVDLSILRV